MTMTWRNYYSRPLKVSEFIVGRTLVHLEFLYTIILRRPKRIVEVGCGTAAHSILLSYFIPFVLSLDIDKNIVKNAMTNVKRFKGKVQLFLADARFLPFKDRSFDVSFSQGFLEHFSEEVCRIVKEQSRISACIVYSLPSNHYPRKDFGDERLLSPKSWHKILKGCLGSRVSVDVRYYIFNVHSFVLRHPSLDSWHILVTLVKGT